MIQYEIRLCRGIGYDLLQPIYNRSDNQFTFPFLFGSGIGQIPNDKMLRPQYELTTYKMHLNLKYNKIKDAVGDPFIFVHIHLNVALVSRFPSGPFDQPKATAYALRIQKG